MLQRGHSGDGCDLASTLCKYDLRKIVFLSLGVLKLLYVCVRDVMDVVFFCLYFEAWSCRYSCIGSMCVSLCRCCMLVSCAYPVAIINAAFCMTCSLLKLVEDARGDHMEEAYSRVGLITALYVAMSVSHPVAVSVFIIFVVACVLLN